MANAVRTRGIMRGELNFDECLSYLHLKPSLENNVEIISISHSSKVHFYNKRGKDITNSKKVGFVSPEAISLIPQSIIDFDSPEIKNAIESKIITTLTDDNYNVESCEVVSKVELNCTVKYNITIKINGLNKISSSVNATKYRNTDNYNDFIEMLWDNVYRVLSIYNIPSIPVDRIKRNFYQEHFFPKFKQKIAAKGYFINSWDVNKIHLITHYCTCGYTSSLSVIDIFNDIKLVPDSSHKFFKGGIVSAQFSSDAEEYINKCVDTVCKEIERTSFFCIPKGSNLKSLKNLYPEAFSKAKEYSKEIDNIFSKLYFGKNKNSKADNPDIYINIKNNNLKFDYCDAVLMFDAINNSYTFKWNDKSKQIIQLYKKSSSLRKKIEDLLSQKQSYIVPSSKKFSGLMTEGTLNLLISYKGLNKSMVVVSPGIDDKELWIQNVYNPIKNSITELNDKFEEQQQALIEKQKSYRNTHIYWGIYSVVSANEDYITATGIVHMLRGTGEKITSQMNTVPEAGQFNYYKKEEIEKCINELCSQGILIRLYRKNDYVDYCIYRPGQPFALNSEVKYTQKELEPLFNKPHKLSDVESISLLHYYQGRKRLCLKDYMLMLKCMSDYIIIAKADEIGQRFAGCPDEIKSMLELMIDKEKERALKKAYKTILGAI